MALRRIIWTNADSIHWRIYAAPEGDALNSKFYTWHLQTRTLIEIHRVIGDNSLNNRLFAYWIQKGIVYEIYQNPGLDILRAAYLHWSIYPEPKHF